MPRLSVPCPSFGQSLAFDGQRLHEGHDFVLRSNCHGQQPDVLIFLDSRGVSRRFEGSLANRLIETIEASNRRYLLVCRPLELTTWATLVNFISANDIRPGVLFTNVGFVDFTPKKLAILEDAVRQVEVRIGPGAANPFFVETYTPSGGEPLSLYAIRYSSGYREHVEHAIARQPTFIIDTPRVSPDIQIEKKRPSAFFPALDETRAFIRSISGAVVIPLPDFDETLTYDALHYTDLGNELIYKEVGGYL